MKIIQYCLKQSMVLNLLTLFVFLTGFYFMMTMQREAFPHVAMDIMVITTPYPGSSPKEVEKLITIPVERALKEVYGIDELHSVSIEGRSSVIIVIDEKLSNSDVEKTKTDIQRAVDRISDLPEDVDTPNVHEIRAHQMKTIDINLTGLDEKLLRQQADLLEDRIELIPGVSSIGKRGYRNREFWVEVNPEILKDYHLSLSEIVASLQMQNINMPGGTSSPKGKELLVRTVGEIETKEQISKVVIRSNDLGNANIISDVAEVSNTFEEETRIEKLRGHRSIGLEVLKHRSADSIEVVQKIKEEIKNFKKSAPKELLIETFNDTSYYVKRRLKVLLNNGWLGMILVLCVIFFFLSRRIAMITSLGIPFAFCLTLIVLNFVGININLISMFGLIIVSGMIVDDGIVFAENIYRHMQKGKSSYEAAITGGAEVFKPVMATVITTIIAFLPLAFMQGTMGKFVWQIPAVVIIALLASVVEAVIILPVHCAEWVDPKKERMATPGWLERLKAKYLFYLKQAIQFKYRVLGGALGIFALSTVIATQFMDFRLFPAKGIEIFFIKGKTAVGTPISDTSKYLEAIENLVKKLPDNELDTFTTQVGIIRKDINDPFTRRGSHVGQITVQLTPESHRKRDANDIILDLQAKTKNLPGFEEVWFNKVSPGPPVGKPVSINIRGDDFDMLQKISNEFKQELKSLKGVKEIQDSFEHGKREIRLIVDSLRAAQAGISVSDIAKTVRNAFEGTVATTIKKADEEIDIRVRLAKSFRDKQEVFDILFVPNKQGHLIPLKEVCRIEEGEGISYVNHFNYKRTIAVTATIDPKQTTSRKIHKHLEKKFKNLSNTYVGYDAKYGGEQKDTAKSMNSLKRSFVFAFIAIFFILCVIFRSLIQPFIVLMTVPLSIIGVVFSFFTHGYEFSFMAILGMVGLTGVVVNNGIILIDLINVQRKQGLEVYEAILEATQKRFRPILLTSATTILGLGPVAYGLGGDDPILRPTAMTITWGILFSSALTLFVVPCLYQCFHEWVGWLKRKVQTQNKVLQFVVNRIKF